MAKVEKSGTKVKLTNSAQDKHSQVVVFRYKLKDGSWEESKMAFDASNSREDILASIKEYVTKLEASANATPADLSADLGREYDLVDLPDRIKPAELNQEQL